MNAIEMENIRQTFNGKTVLDLNILKINGGERIALVGPNGSGKTTLLTIMALLAPPTAGVMKVNGSNIDWNSPDKHRMKITLVSQEPYFFAGSLLGNMTFGLQSRGMKKKDANNRAFKYIDLLKLRGFEKRSPRTFSTGERKRAAFARALCLETPILLLDEPFANVDTQSSSLMEEIIRNLDRSRTIIFSTHELSRAYELTDRIITLHDGRISPWTPENIIRMIAKKVGDGFELSTQSGKVIYYPGELENGGTYKVSINPRDIIVSSRPIESSARNRFNGVLRKIESIGENLAELSIDCPPDLPIKATVTTRTVREFGWTIGDEVWISFKSAALHIM